MQGKSKEAGMVRDHRKHLFSYLLPACVSYQLASFFSSISLVSSCLIQLQTTSYTRLPLWCQVAHVQPQNCLSFTLDLSLCLTLLYSTLYFSAETHQDKVVHTAVWVEAGVFHDDCLTTTKATEEALIVCSSSPYSPLLSLCYRLPLCL